MADYINFPLLMTRLLYLMSIIIPLRGIGAIHINDIKVPPRAPSGKTVRLACYYSLGEGTSLYSLNWWRGSEQFYQFEAKGQTKITVYATSGITVDKKKSTQNFVVLKNVSRATGGKFKCEVLSSSFEKDSREGYMEVVDVPDHPPKVGLDRRQWSPGEKLVANCSYPGVMPEPHLQWSINFKQIPSQHSRMITATKGSDHHIPNALMLDRRGGGGGEGGEEGEQGGYGVSLLNLDLKPDHFQPDGRAILSCSAHLNEIYRWTANVTFTLPGFREPAPSQKFYGSGHPTEKGNVTLMMTLLGLLLMVMRKMTMNL